MRRTVAVLAVAALTFGCGTDDRDLSPLEAELGTVLEGRDLAMYVAGVEPGSGGRVTILTQLDEGQTAEADAICNNTTAAASVLDGMDVSGVDVAAAGGRNIAHC